MRYIQLPRNILCKTRFIRWQSLELAPTSQRIRGIRRKPAIGVSSKISFLRHAATDHFGDRKFRKHNYGISPTKNVLISGSVAFCQPPRDTDTWYRRKVWRWWYRRKLEISYIEWQIEHGSGRGRLFFRLCATPGNFLIFRAPTVVFFCNLLKN